MEMLLPLEQEQKTKKNMTAENKQSTLHILQAGGFHSADMLSNEFNSCSFTCH